MDINKGRSFLKIDDVKKHSIWRFDDKDDLIYPIFDIDDIPDNSFDLKIRAEFITANGIKLIGYIVGVKNIFSITIFVDDKIFRFNKNLIKDCIERLEKLSEVLGEKITLADFSPIKYTTTIDLKGFKNISGEFDLSKRMTDAERLGEYYIEPKKYNKK